MVAPAALTAQANLRGIAGTWEAETPDGPQKIVVRPDSTATFGEETVRWKISADTIYLEIGDEWLAYNFDLNGDSLTLSGGDLLDPVTLRRVGPPSRLRAAATETPRGRQLTKESEASDGILTECDPAN
jgi:hypothetical protein